MKTDVTCGPPAFPGPIDLAAIEAELRPLSSDRLRAVFVESYSRAAEFIARAAVCVKLMEERGESLRGIPQAGLFRRVAAGQVLPDLVWRFLEAPAPVRQLVERLPLSDQKKLVQNPVVPVAEPDAAGGFTHRLVDLTRAPVETVRQVIGPDGFRSPEEQVALVEAHRHRPRHPAAPAPEDAADLPLDRVVTVKLTAAESAALKINAARARVSEQKMARRGLLLSGVLREGFVPKGRPF